MPRPLLFIVGVGLLFLAPLSASPRISPQPSRSSAPRSALNRSEVARVYGARASRGTLVARVSPSSRYRSSTNGFRVAAKPQIAPSRPLVPVSSLRTRRTNPFDPFCPDPILGQTSRPGIALGTYYFERGLTAPGDSGAVASWRAQMGEKLPAVWMIYQWWTGWNQFPAHHARRAQAMGGRFMVTWEPWNGNLYDSAWNCRAIARGGRDSYIRSYARAVRESGVPVMIRLGHEMNGDWYPWGTAYASSTGRHNGNSPQDFVAMWRRVVSIFRQENAKNASWVWAPNIFFMNATNTRNSQIQDLRALYPGDDFVNWIGLSVYNDGARRPWKSFSTLFGDSYDSLSKMSRKPMMIAELGVTEEGAPRGDSKAKWITNTFLAEIPARYPRVRLVNYFSRDRRAFGESDYRFDTSPASLHAFRTVANSPLYQGRLGID